MLRLEILRLGEDWSNAELARRSGLNVTTVNEACRGQRRPGPHQLVSLAAAFSLGPEMAGTLLDEVEPASPGPRHEL